MQQIPLEIRMPANAQFSNYIASSNAVLIQDLKEALKNPAGQCFYLWGAAGSGKTHLLKASCHDALNQNWPTMYLPMEHCALAPNEIASLSHIKILCLDDVDKFVGEQAREEALFHLFNQLREQGGCLIVTALCSPAQLPCVLPDLKSRLSWGGAYQLHMLDDDAKLQVLISRAQAMGLELSEEVGQYIMTRISRDMHQLQQLLQQLDAASLANQRRLSIPFVKTVLQI